jgi:transcriptional regulator with XRE-family HTH domain
MPTVSDRVNLQSKRLERGWTLEALAQQCAAKGTPTAISNLHRIENGKQVPRPRLRATLAQLLGVAVTDFDREAG